MEVFCCLLWIVMVNGVMEVGVVKMMCMGFIWCNWFMIKLVFLKKSWNFKSDVINLVKWMKRKKMGMVCWMKRVRVRKIWLKLILINLNYGWSDLCCILCWLVLLVFCLMVKFWFIWFKWRILMMFGFWKYESY